MDNEGSKGRNNSAHPRWVIIRYTLSPLRIRTVLTLTLDGSQAHFLFCLKVSSGEFSLRQKNHLSFVVSYPSHCSPCHIPRTLSQGGTKPEHIFSRSEKVKDIPRGPTAFTSVSSVSFYGVRFRTLRTGQEHPTWERKRSEQRHPQDRLPHLLPSQHRSPDEPGFHGRQFCGWIQAGPGPPRPLGKEGGHGEVGSPEGGGC